MNGKPAPADSETSAFTCLVVDDHEQNRSLLRRMIENVHREVRVLEAADGSEAIVILDRERPDVLISDIQMPNLDGWALVRWLRGDARFQRMPVMLVSSIDPEALRAGATRAGVTVTLSRPFLFDQFREAFARLQEAFVAR